MKIDWREVQIFLLATSLMTIGTVAMAAGMAEKTGNNAWFLLVGIFPALSVVAGIRTRGKK